MAIKSGFSLIELTVVVDLISLLSLAIASSLLMSVVSTNRVRNLTKIKQAGDTAIDHIQTLVRGARDISTCDSILDSLILGNLDGGTTILTTEVDNSVTRIASNSGVYLTPSNLTVSNFSLTCSPTDDEPKLVDLAFDLSDNYANSRESRPLHFATSINLRNE